MLLGAIRYLQPLIDTSSLNLIYFVLNSTVLARICGSFEAHFRSPKQLSCNNAVTVSLDGIESSILCLLQLTKENDLNFLFLPIFEVILLPNTAYINVITPYNAFCKGVWYFFPNIWIKY